ncbi:hypothetical protein L7F22_056623 [Adiantum nelumboides]|nr:hypothetical protein [Adiantum nelumboides]
MKGGDAQSTDGLIRAVLRKMAHAHYIKQSRERKAEVRKSFNGMDESEDGKISLEEFMESTDEGIRSCSAGVVAKIFSYVDEDKSGFLEFDEFLVFTFIMDAGFQICDACLCPVIIAGYTCKTCWSQRGHDSAHDTYDLCTTCFASHDHPASHELVDICHMYHHLLTSDPSPPAAAPAPSESGDEVQCIVCDEYHTTNVEGLLVKGDNHVVERHGNFVCEWCASYMCIHCKIFLSDAAYNDLTVWQCLKAEFWCEKCDKGDGSYEPDVDEILERLKKSDIPKRCTTCAKHLKNGTFGKEEESTNETSRRLVPLTYMEMVTARMQTNLLLQQSYFNAASMISGAAALTRLA